MTLLILCGSFHYLCGHYLELCDLHPASPVPMSGMCGTHLGLCKPLCRCVDEKLG